MRKVILLLLIPLSLLAQNIIDPPTLINGSTANKEVISRKQNDFLLGWNWGSQGAKLDTALFINAYHDIPNSNDNDKIDSVIAIEQFLWPQYIVGNRFHNAIINSMSLYLEPTITIDNSQSFIPTNRNTNGAVFGFKERKKIKLENSPSDPDFGRIKLLKDSLDNPAIPEIVLSDVSDRNILKSYNYPAIPKIGWENIIDSSRMNGKELFVSINLKSLEAITNANPNDVILTLKLKYKLWDDRLNICGGDYFDSNYVKFKNLPKVSGNISDDTIQIYGSRGDWRGIRRDTADSVSHTLDLREFNITAAMLDANGNGTADSNITLSAFTYFRTEFDLFGNYKWNPPFESDWWDRANYEVYIKDLDVEVTYHGKLDVAIDWIRLETPRARDIYDGKYDDSVYYEVKRVLASLNPDPTHPSLLRFYGADELRPQQWGINRYFNMLVDTLMNVELSVAENKSISKYIHALDVKELWTGDNITYSSEAGNPYARYGLLRDSVVGFDNGVPITQAGSPESLNYFYGFSGNYRRYVDLSLNVTENPAKIFTDTLNSDYETFIAAGDSVDGTIPISTSISPFDSTYNDVCNKDDVYYLESNLFNSEYTLYQKYYKKGEMLYHPSLYWWANLWVVTANDYDASIDSRTIPFRAQRPRTGEEIRYMNSIPILLGTKGFFYWFKTSDNSSIGLQNSNTTGFQASLPSKETLVYDDAIGGDYRVNSDPNPLIDGIVPSKIRLDILGQPSSRIYMGLKSTRAEIYKTNKWIRQVEDDLMNFKLEAWYGKGFTKWYSQNPENPETDLMSLLIDRDNITTRKIWDAKYNTYDSQPENSDSSFFDITLLKKSDYPMFQVYYIGIQNRRTDPLIRTFDTVGVAVDSSLKFYSTAEFDDFVRNGGNNLLGQSKSKEYWREQWWKRLGCREIAIPFNYTYAVDDDDVYYQISELGVGTALDTNWWRSKDLMDRVDTSFADGGTLKVRLLPGEGKILKVKIAKQPQEFAGNLDFSNQRKIVAYPVYTASQLDTNNVNWMAYYSVYYKPDSTDENKYGVYYREGVAADTNDQFNHIVWYSTEYKLSDSIYVYYGNGNCDSLYRVKSRNCKYPSIVVRYDSTQTPPEPYVYVTYTCEPDSVPTNNLDSSSVWIVENVFKANQVGLNPPEGIKDARLIARATSFDRDIDKYGHSTINASYNGNYYAWNDQLTGITAAWKSPGARCFDFSNHLLNLKVNPGFEGNHPSLNTYSRLRYKEDNSSLVWTEKPFGSDPMLLDYSEVYYTRLRIDNNKLINYNSTDQCDSLTINTPIKYIGDSIYCLSCIEDLGDTLNVFRQHQFPIVFRTTESNVERYIAGNYDAMLAVKHDRIYWQGLNSENEPSIFTAGMDTFDTLNSNNEWIADCIRPVFSTFISSQTRDLYYPNVAQGGLRKYWDAGSSSYLYTQFESSWGANDSKQLVLDFMSTTRGNAPSSNDQIWHIPHGYFALLYNGGTLQNNFENHVDAYKLSRTGKYPNLAAMPIMSNDSYYRFNRRIFNSNDNDPSNIKASLDFYLKRANNEEYYAPMFGYIDNKGKYSFYSYFSIEDENGKFIIPKINFMEKDGDFGYKYTKEIKTDWFEVNKTSKIYYISQNNNAETFRLIVERKSDNRMFDLPLFFTSSKTKKGMELTNGKGEKYRLVMKANSNKLNFMQQLYLYENMDETMFKKGNTEMYSVDLETGAMNRGEVKFSVYPNPADKELHISTTYNDIDNYNVEILDIIGRTVIKQNITNTSKINVSNLTTGIYSVKLTTNQNGSEVLLGIDKVIIK